MNKTMNEELNPIDACRLNARLNALESSLWLHRQHIEKLEETVKLLTTQPAQQPEPKPSTGDGRLDLWTDWRAVVEKDVRMERAEQLKKWGYQAHGTFKWLAILSEELGEAAEAMLDKDMVKVRKEVIQIAAVASAIAQCIDKGEA